MHLATYRADQFYEAPFDGHVDVLVGQRPAERSRLDLTGDLSEPGKDLLALFGREHADAGEHAYMRLRAADVERRQHVIEGDG